MLICRLIFHDREEGSTSVGKLVAGAVLVDDARHNSGCVVAVLLGLCACSVSVWWLFGGGGGGDGEGVSFGSDCF